ncbi:hypothetical protein Zm00014a_041418, partial [Zea mays]
CCRGPSFRGRLPGATRSLSQRRTRPNSCRTRPWWRTSSPPSPPRGHSGSSAARRARSPSASSAGSSSCSRSSRRSARSHRPSVMTPTAASPSLVVHSTLLAGSSAAATTASRSSSAAALFLTRTAVRVVYVRSGHGQAAAAIRGQGDEEGSDHLTLNHPGLA